MCKSDSLVLCDRKCLCVFACLCVSVDKIQLNEDKKNNEKMIIIEIRVT